MERWAGKRSKVTRVLHMCWTSDSCSVVRECIALGAIVVIFFLGGLGYFRTFMGRW